MVTEQRNCRIRGETLKTLRIISRVTGVKMVRILERLVCDELERLKKKHGDMIAAMLSSEEDNHA